MSSDKFAALKFNATNIGDEIQSLAAQQFLPRVDYYIYRDFLNKFSDDVENNVKLIMNSWYMWRPKNFPPSDRINPLLISMSIADTIRGNFLKPDVKDWFIKHGPVGCRDMETLHYFESNDIPAYFSGCLTLTLNGGKKEAKKPYVLCANVSDKVIYKAKTISNIPVCSISKLFTPYISSEDRMILAKAVLYLFNNASVVLTSNLHTAMPCLAMGVPVCLIDPETYDYNRNGRFDGMINFLHHYSEKEFLEHDVYNITNPPDNPREHLKIRNKLIQTCKNFTGYYNPSPIWDDMYNVEVDLLNIISESRANIRRTLWWAHPAELLYVLLRKVLLREDRIDAKSDFFGRLNK